MIWHTPQFLIFPWLTAIIFLFLKIRTTTKKMSGQSTFQVTEIGLHIQIRNEKISGIFTMWRKSNGVAVWRSQFNLSRIILSILRISDEEHPQKLSLANTFSTGILYPKQRGMGQEDRTEKNKLSFCFGKQKIKG